ncbi:GFA family protein [Pseudoruegeria sp. SK021]|uniref:GFA family protein n=1 Tax=Pseudoruegeria sp. SK021 TaxID=1933035 RepID=UPI000A25A5EC|nr:GFA family protein [Pseudoruegeria sp. SK021]OSP54436.1 aldehyde-activating protein [Pseudoruegeria sp. SK021]
MDGQCLCGAVVVSATPAKAELHACHCEMCRRWTGSALIEVDVDPAQLQVTGPVKTFRSSDWAERAWCDTCGSTLWYKLTLPGHERYAVSAGLFDAAGDLPLTKEIYIDCKPGGYAFAGDHQTMTKQEVEAMFASFGEGDQQ